MLGNCTSKVTTGVQAPINFPGAGQLRAWEALEKVGVVDGEAADSDEAFVKQAKLKIMKPGKEYCLA